MEGKWEKNGIERKMAEERNESNDEEWNGRKDRN